ncbi:MAG: glycosyl transferase, partial [Hyphomicrobiaceae bacterium]
MSTGLSLVGGATIIFVTGVVTAALITLLKPALRRYALARPNARSSHAEPTPQGAGAAIITMPIAVLLMLAVSNGATALIWPLQLAVALIVLAVIGALDDIWSMPVAMRLIGQIAAAGVIVHALPQSTPIIPFLPYWVEMAGLVIGLVWFINLTNFMDGIDGITIVEMICIATGIVLIAAITGAENAMSVVPIAVGLIGALLGFVPFNRHIASVFMGDVGSLPIGALVGWMLIVVAIDGSIAAALLLPMYYLADATITLLRRLRRRERLYEAHRSHSYQLAV